MTQTSDKVVRELQHRNSTKLLVGRFEAMAEKSSQSQLIPYTPTKVTASRKGRSPLRSSFLNLMSVFKRGGVMNSQGKPSHSPMPPISHNVPVCGQPSRHPPNSPALTGSLFYLFQPAISQLSSPILPVWINCNIAIHSHPNCVVIKWETSMGTPATQVVALDDFSDVRSLSPSDLAGEEHDLLPNAGKESLRVFEISFLKKRPERFAAASASERASWISAIWEAIIPSNEPPTDLGGTVSKFSRVQDQSLICINPDEDSSDRPLPPLPPPLRSEGGNPSGTSPKGHSEVAVSPQSISSVLRSPSIKTLSQKSVVSQRLVQIEAVHRDSASMPRKQSVVDSQSSTMIDRAGSTRSTYSCSILESYAVGHLETTGRELDSSGIFSRSPSFVMDGPSYAPTLPSKFADKAEEELTSEPTKDFSLDALDAFKALREDLVRMPGEISGLILSSADVLPSLDTSVQRLVQSSQGNQEELRGVCAQVEGLRGHIEKLSQSALNSGDLIQSVQALQLQVGVGINEVVNLIHELSDSKQRPALNEHLDAISDMDAKRLPTTPPEANDVFDTPRQLVQSSDSGLCRSSEVDLTAQLKEILAALKEQESHSNLQGRRQEDGLRYLNELNAWLEKFVTNATPATIELTPEGPANTLGEIKQLVDQTDRDTAGLHSAVSNLISLVKDSISHKSDPSLAVTPDILQEQLNRQKESNEVLLRSIAAELSQDIKGERLRFIEAIKAATEINIAHHVDQFKKQLGVEIAAMTHEVQHMQREKQTIENQIAELFAFYSKQKQLAERSFPLRAPGASQQPTNPQQLHVMQQAYAHQIPGSSQVSPSAQRRPSTQYPPSVQQIQLNYRH